MTQETKKFADFNLRPELLRALDRKGFETPMPVQVCVLEDETLIDSDIILEGIGRTKILSEYLNIFPDLNSITPESLEDDGLYGRGYSFGERISIEKDLGGDTNVLLYVRNVATFHPRVSDTRFLERMWENLPHRIDQRNAMIEMMDPLKE